MSISIKFNSADVKRITGKLNKLKENCSTAEGSKLTRLVLTLADEYGKAIVSVMGVVDEEGGSATSTPFLGHTFQVTWLGLSELTKRVKRKEGLTLEIWKATGKTAKAVKVKEFHKQYKELNVFIGIDSSTNPEEYEKAINNEFGGYNGIRDNSRALFTLANRAFLDIREDIIREIKNVIFDGVNWGK